jgi:GNAT superfamily N-acetyltransferase
MFRIRKIYDDTAPANQDAIVQVQAILRAQFPALKTREIRKLASQLRNPLKYRFRSILFVAENGRGQVKGFAFLLHAPDLRFCYLEYISVASRVTGGGIGSALYERVREEALALDAVGLFFECLPDDPVLSRDPDIRRQNVARLKFYERYGARPIVNTAYETPLNPGEDNPPYLMFDALGRREPLGREVARPIVRAILERKYGDVCPKSYIDGVVASFNDDPVQLRGFRHPRGNSRQQTSLLPVRSRRIALIVNAKHEIHHVHERGYVESPVRIGSILKEILPLELFEQLPVRHYSQAWIKAVHDAAFVDYLKRACAAVGPEKSIYPYVFPIRNAARPPRELPVRAGYYLYRYLYAYQSQCLARRHWGRGLCADGGSLLAGRIWPSLCPGSSARASC